MREGVRMPHRFPVWGPGLMAVHPGARRWTLTGLGSWLIHRGENLTIEKLATGPGLWTHILEALRARSALKPWEWVGSRTGVGSVSHRVGRMSLRVMGRCHQVPMVCTAPGHRVGDRPLLDCPSVLPC